jgi:hydrogenase maturation protein HypF
VKPDLIACDLHPGYLSSQWAERFARKLDLPLIKVQHHEAHLASLLADVSWSGNDLLGVCFDGTGFGTDRAIWGGEFFRIDKSRSKRVGHLKYVSLPGGDLSIKRPYRLALAHLWAAGIPWSEDIPAVAACPPAERAILRQQLEKNANCTPTSSMGRLFDAVSSLLGVNQLASYEGQPAVELETIADSGPQEPYPFEIISGNPFQIDPTPLVHAIVQDLFKQVSAATISARFHATIAEMICYFARLFRQQAGLDTLGLTGGVFQNMRLLKEVIQRLNNEKFTILTHQQVPTNDGGISLGQCLIARGQISS